jgi:formylglycine-generating enzyme required for sulfatase activity
MPQAPPIPARGQTLAIVLGASRWPRYPHFQDAPAFRTSLEDVADYLRDPYGFGLPSRNVKVMIDAHEEASEIILALRRFLAERRRELEEAGTPAADLLFYYVGHGGFAGRANTFFLSVRATDVLAPLHTSIPADALGDIIRDGAGGLRSYLILDCCFAAAAVDSLMSAPLDAARLQLEDTLPEGGDDETDAAGGELPGYGVALLCAAGRREPAQAPAGLAHTMFTGGLLSVLREGERAAPAFLSLGELHDLVRQRLARAFPETAVLPELHVPQQRQGHLERVRLFRNPARGAVRGASGRPPPASRDEGTAGPAASAPDAPPGAGDPAALGVAGRQEVDLLASYRERERQRAVASAAPPAAQVTLPAVGPSQAFWASGRAPGWALEWDTDRYGPWVSFLVPSHVGPPLAPRMRWAPPGWFMMGSPDDEPGRFEDEGPQHPVTFAQGFWICETACTEELWQAITGKTPEPNRGPSFPVTGVSWNDVQSFVGKLDAQYPELEIGLPSEAQWEYACRAGTTARYSFGDEISPALARYLSAGPVEVASLPANDWGLHEMHGNVQEWCADRSHGNYAGAPSDGSVWDSSAAPAFRVLRGGSWGNGARFVRSAFRGARDPAFRGDSIGFRCARVQRAKKAEAPAGRAGSGKQA